MRSGPAPRDEAARLAALRDLRVLDTEPEPELVEIVRFVRDALDVPIASLTFVDEARVWHLASVGLEMRELPRAKSFATYALDAAEELLIVPDTLRDPRFVAHPLVVRSPHVRFYGGAPIVDRDARVLGVVAALDHRPRELDAAQRRWMQLGARQTFALLDARAARERALDRAASARAELDVLEVVAASTVDLHSLVDREYRYRFVNETYTRYWNVTPAQIIGRTVAEILGQATFEAASKPMLDRALAGEPVTFELLTRFPALGPRRMQVQYDPAMNEKGEIFGVVVLARDIELLRSRDDDLARLNTELEKKTRDQDRFIHILSHDLREPLNTIGNFTGLLAETRGAETDEGRYLGFVRQGVTRMRTLLDDLQTYLRVGKDANGAGRVALDDVLAGVRSDLTDQLTRTGGTLEIAPALPVVAGDASLLRLVFQNLVSNALKFVAPKTAPRVTVSGAADGGLARIAVRDEGIGIDAAAFAEIFVPFTRLHSRKRYPGTGLGLAVVEQCVKLHGGSIEVASTPGSGTTFTVALPLHA